MNPTDHARDLAVLVGSRKLARDILARTTVRRLATASEPELALIMPAPAARRMHAAFRLALEAVAPRRPARLLGPADAHAHLFPYLAACETERLVVVCCDAKNVPVHTEVVAMGAVNGVAARPVEVLAPAIRHQTPGILVGHNHPSNDPTPSQEDLELTRGLLLACRLIGIELLDHLVVAGRYYRSCRDELEGRGADLGGARLAAEGA